MGHRGLQPDMALAPLVGLVLLAHAAERERCGYRLERLDADRDADHDGSGPPVWREAAALLAERLRGNVGP
jgi:hypothetical protein